MTTATVEHEASAMRHIHERLITVYGRAATAAVSAAMDREIARFADAPIREYVPLLVERLTRDDLRNQKVSS